MDANPRLPEMRRPGWLAWSLIALAACGWAAPWQHDVDCRQRFTDVQNWKVSPDGKLKASEVLENYGPMAGTTYGLVVGGLTDDMQHV